MIPFRMMFPHIGVLVGLFRILRICGEPPPPPSLTLSLFPSFLLPVPPPPGPGLPAPCLFPPSVLGKLTCLVCADVPLVSQQEKEMKRKDLDRPPLFNQASPPPSSVADRLPIGKTPLMYQNQACLTRRPTTTANPRPLTFPFTHFPQPHPSPPPPTLHTYKAGHNVHGCCAVLLTFYCMLSHVKLGLQLLRTSRLQSLTCPGAYVVLHITALHCTVRHPCTSQRWTLCDAAHSSTDCCVASCLLCTGDK